MVLIQKLSTPINGLWDGGAKSTFEWSIEPHRGTSTHARVGSWGANHFFTVKRGATEKLTLANARRALALRARHQGLACTFTYKD